MKLYYIPTMRTNTNTNLASAIQADKTRRVGRKLRLICFAAVVAAAMLLYGCGGSETASASSSSSSESSEQVSSAAQNSGTKAHAVSSQSSSKPGGDYVLPSGSGTNSDSTSENTLSSGSNPAASVSSSVQQSSAGASGSQPVYQSFFGSEPDDSSKGSASSDTSGSRISEGEYNRIQSGMTYAQVKSIIGSDGKLQREFGQKGSELYTAQYRWSGNGNGASYADITFENGTVDSKIEFGLD